MCPKNVSSFTDFFPTVPIHDRIPPGMATNETWMLHGRRAIPKSQPTAFFKPDDFVPERFGYQEGIPLYRYDQTRSYNPRPETIAAQQYYDFFVCNQNRHRHSRWERGWKTHDKFLSRAFVWKNVTEQPMSEKWLDELQEKVAACWEWHSPALQITFRYTKPDQDDDFWEIWYKIDPCCCWKAKPGEKRRDGHDSSDDSRCNSPIASDPVGGIPHVGVVQRLWRAKTVKSVFAPLKIKPQKTRRLPRNRLSLSYQKAVKRAFNDAVKQEWRRKKDRRPLPQGNFTCRIETYATEDILDLFSVSFGWETNYDCLGREYRRRINKIARVIPRQGQWPYVSTWAKDMDELMTKKKFPNGLIGGKRKLLTEEGEIIEVNQRIHVGTRFIACFMAVAEFALLIDKNQDSTLPHRRAQQLWEALYAKGLLPVRFCARKWAVCRESLVEYGIIKITNRDYYPGKAMEWSVGTYFPGLGLWKGKKQRGLGCLLRRRRRTTTRRHNTWLRQQPVRSRLWLDLARSRPPP